MKKLSKKQQRRIRNDMRNKNKGKLPLKRTRSIPEKIKVQSFE